MTSDPPSPWRTDIDNAPRDRTLIDLIVTETPSAAAKERGSKGNRMRYTDVWWSDIKGAWVYDALDRGQLEVETGENIAGWTSSITHWMLAPALPPIEE